MNQNIKKAIKELYKISNENVPIDNLTHKQLENIYYDLTNEEIMHFCKIMNYISFRSKRHRKELLIEIIKIYQDKIKTFLDTKMVNNYLKNDDLYDQPQNSTIYFLKNKKNNKVKIGCTNNLKKRIQQIEGAFKLLALEYDLELIYSININDDFLFKIESEIHEKFKNYHYEGEWFNIGDFSKEDIIKFLNIDVDFYFYGHLISDEYLYKQYLSDSLSIFGILFKDIDSEINILTEKKEELEKNLDFLNDVYISVAFNQI